MQIPRSTVGRITADEDELNPVKRSGRPKMLTSPQRKRLIEWATLDSSSRRLSLTEIARQAGIQDSSKLLQRTFAQEGYHRRVARQKPFLNAVSKGRRLEWPQLHAEWTILDWARVLWTDESSFNIGDSQSTVLVTRWPGEEYLEDCLQVIPKFKKLRSLMDCGAISAREKKEVLIWDSKEGGRITSKSYVQYILIAYISPILESERWYYQSPVYLMEDNAPPHAAQHSEQARSEHQIPTLPHGCQLTPRI